MNAVKIAAAAALTLIAIPAVQAGSFRAWLLADAPQWLQDPHPARSPALDNLAQGCMDCHDGRRASRVHVRAAGSAMVWTRRGSAGHPVGMRYADFAARRPNDYVPAAHLDPAIRLVDGRVTCVSCHRLADSREPPRAGFVKVTWTTAPGGNEQCTASRELTVPGRETDLCLSCHVK